MKRILIIDHDSYICNLITNFLNQNGFYAESALSGSHGLKIFLSQHFDLVLCDYHLPETNGLNLLKKIKAHNANVPVIILAQSVDIKVAVKSIKAGAYDCIVKPIQHEELLEGVKQALKQKKNKILKSALLDEFVIGECEEIIEVMKHVDAVAPTDLTVLVEGETGSGKEFIARALHNKSQRREKPFIAVDCGAISKELANSELFGHVKGAFTGAIKDKKGYFELAKGGTLFLDEVSNLPPENQAKLLRAIQEQRINRVGGNKSIKTDVRLIAASNNDLIESTLKEQFREDLYHRLNGFKIQLPPLRNRGDDVMIFTQHFIRKANEAFHKKVLGISDQVKVLFMQYPWYGNIRELQNVINRAVLLCSNSVIETNVLPNEILDPGMQLRMAKKRTGKELNDSSVKELKEATESTEKEMIIRALLKFNHNKSKAAEFLNVDRKTLYNKIKQYKIDVVN